MAVAETATAIVATPAIGGIGYQHVGEMILEYSSSGTVTLTSYPDDTGNNSYGFQPISLPNTGGVLTKYFLRPSPNKWKLLVFQFTSATPFILNFEGFCAKTKSWGSTSEYAPIQPFGGAGGLG